MIGKGKSFLVLFFILCISFFHINQVFSGTQEDIIDWLTSTQNDDGSWEGTYRLLEDYGIDETLKKKNYDTDGTDPWAYSFYCNPNNTPSKLACKFSPSESYTCKKIILPLQKVNNYGSDEPVGDIWVTIGTISNNIPVESEPTWISSHVNPASSISDTLVNVEFLFPNTVELIKNETYFIILQGNLSDDGTKNVAWKYRIESGNGNLTKYLENGWSHSSWYRLLFEVWGDNTTFTNYSQHNRFCANATLSVTKALLLYKNTMDIEDVLSKALNWVENQEFFNVEYLSRQIEVFSLAGEKSDLYIDKLLSLKNSDGGWGEAKGYKSNPLDTAWALKALLSSGCRDYTVIQQGVEAIISYTNKTNPQNSEDMFTWSTFYPTYHSDEENWYPRNTSSIVSALVLDLINAYPDVFDELQLTNQNFVNFASIKTNLQSFLYTKLGELYNDDNFFTESNSIATVLKKCDLSDSSNFISSFQNSFPSYLKEDQNGKSFKDDPYLTALALETLASSEDTLNGAIVTLAYDSGNLDVNLSTETYIKTINFYIKKANGDNYELLPFDWTAQTTNKISIALFPNLKAGDYMGVLINNSYWDEKEYIEFGADSPRIFTISSRDISVYELDAQNEVVREIEDNIIHKIAETTNVRIVTRIFNYYPNPTILSIHYKLQDSILGDPLKQINTIPSQQTITDYIDCILPIYQVGHIQVDVNISYTGGNDSASRDFYVISEINTVNTDLKAPLFPNYEIVKRERVFIYWEAPLDPNVVGYKVLREYTINDNIYYEFEGITNSTSLECNIYNDPETYVIYSLDKDNKRSANYAQITANYSYPNDVPIPIIDITYPKDNQIVLWSDVENSDAGNLDSIEIRGTITNFTSYKMSLTEGEHVYSLGPEHNSVDNESVIKTFLFDNEGFEFKTGYYTLEIKAKNATSDWTTTKSIPIQLQKWVKSDIAGGYNAKNPSWDISGDSIIFSSNKNEFDYLDSQGLFYNIWQMDNLKNPNITLQLSPLTIGVTNNLEPTWADAHSFVYASYRTGNRNLVVMDNDGYKIGHKYDLYEKKWNPLLRNYPVDPPTNAYEFIANKFVPDVTREYTKISLRLKRVGDRTGKAYIEVCGDDGGIPNFGDLNKQTSEDIDTENITTYAEGEYVDFIFSNSFELTQGTTYWIALRGKYGWWQQETPNEIYWAYSTAQPNYTLLNKKSSGWQSQASTSLYKAYYKDITWEENIVNVVYDINGNYSVDNIPLFNDDGEQIYYPKSFYNPDAIKIYDQTNVVASDELGELIFTNINSTYDGGDVIDLTLDLHENDGKTFLSADNPSVKYIDENNLSILFEGYTLEVPRYNTDEHFYLNSDIYLLSLVSPFGVSNISGSDQNPPPDSLYAYGPYISPYSYDIVSLKVYMESLKDVTKKIKCALYSSKTIIYDTEEIPYPDEKLSETIELEFDSTPQEFQWVEFELNQPVAVTEGEKYWVVINHAKDGPSSAYLQKKDGTSGYFECHYHYDYLDTESNTQEFPQVYATTNNIEDETRYSIIMVPRSVSLKQITNTPSESETSPVWMDDISSDGFLDANIAFIKSSYYEEGHCEKDVIYIANLEGLNSSSPYLSNSYSITTPGFFSGVVQNIDYQNYYIAFDELLYDGEHAESSFTSHIGNLKLDSGIHDAYNITISIDEAVPENLPTVVYLYTNQELTIQISRANSSPLLNDAILDYDIYADSNTIHDYNENNFASSGIDQENIGVLNAGTYIAEILLMFKNDLQIRKKFTIIVEETE